MGIKINGIDIGGNFFEGTTVSVKDSTVYVDGKKVAQTKKKGGRVIINKIVGNVNLDCNIVEVHGDIHGDVDSNAITCNDIHGDVDSQAVNCKVIHGDVDAMVVNS